LPATERRPLASNTNASRRSDFFFGAGCLSETCKLHWYSSSKQRRQLEWLDSDRTSFQHSWVLLACRSAIVTARGAIATKQAQSTSLPSSGLPMTSSAPAAEASARAKIAEAAGDGPALPVLVASAAVLLRHLVYARSVLQSTWT